MIKKIFLLFLFCLFSTSVFAQSNDLVDQGTTYSRFGLGWPVVYGSPAAEGMGLWGVSFTEPYVPGAANPAQWGSIVYAVATGGFELKSFYGKDQNGSNLHSILQVNHFQLVLPLEREKLGVSIAFMPYTNTSFKITNEDREIITTPTGQDTLRFMTQKFGNGGINKVEAGIGWRITENISVGYAASLVFAQVDNRFSTGFVRENVFEGIGYTLQTSGFGLGHRFGVFLNFPSVLQENDELSFGASLMLPVELEADRELETLIVNRTPEGKLDADRELDTGTIQLPMGVLAGVTYRPGPQLSFSIEGLYQKWSEFKNTLEPGLENALVDRLKVGAGIRYFPFRSGADSFFSNFKYRLGVSYDRGHLKLKGHRIKTLMFSFGLGYITPFATLANSSIDISFHYGIRGTKADNLVQENIWKVKLSINLAELFFYRPKIR